MSSDDLSDDEIEAAIGKMAEDHIAKASALLSEVNMSWLHGPPETVARAAAIGTLATGHALTGLALIVAVLAGEDRKDEL